MRWTVALMAASLGFCQSPYTDAVPDSREQQYRQAVQANPRSSLAHYQLGAILFQEKRDQAAANEFREALNGDLSPSWVEASSHDYLGRIFDRTGQTERAVNEYRLADEMSGRIAPASFSGAVPEGVPRGGPGFVPPYAVETTEPKYTDEARAAGLEGVVTLMGVIHEDGTQGDMQITGRLGYGLDESALEAVKQWRFLPGRRQGKPVSVLTPIEVEFRLPEIQSRWHLIGAHFSAPPGASPPTFLKTKYPGGLGISTNAFEEARVIGAIGRVGTATIAFEVDEHGAVANARIANASFEIWGNEALNLIEDWQFRPGMQSGFPVRVSGTLDFVWGPATLDAKTVEWASAQMSNAGGRGSPESPPVVMYEGAEPTYTQAARDAGLEGSVALSLLVTVDGSPTDIQVVRGIGMGVDESAVEAVGKWRFRAAFVNGYPAPLRTTVVFGFHKDGSRSTEVGK